MKRNCLVLVLLIQGSFTLANSDEPVDSDTREILNQKPEFDDNVVKDFQDANKDWIDLFFEAAPAGLYSSSSAALMATATNKDKTPEEQVEDIKAIVHQITEFIQSEMVNLLSDAIAHCDKSEEHTKHKRSVETPMDSSMLVMRLLKHIKANNEYQNIAIEKMMTAQQIADKYGIKYDPDEDLLDLASFTNKQSEELSSILNDMTPKKEQVEFVPLNNNEGDRNTANNCTYYVYASDVPEQEIQSHFNSYPSFEYMPEQIRYEPEARPVQQHFNPHPHHSHHNFPETQISAPPVHHPQPTCPRPAFYEPAFTPANSHHPCGPMEPITTTTTIILPFEEPVAPEPELVGQEFEETVSNKVYIEQGEEPGSTDVNHVMTYTVSEKSHFKTPEVEKLPQQMQYYFFMMN